jgi:hypothetical protein
MATMFVGGPRKSGSGGRLFWFKSGVVLALAFLAPSLVGACGGPGHYYSAAIRTWTWNGHQWKALPGTFQGGGSGEQHLAYDPIHGQLVLIGKDPNGSESTTSTRSGGRWILTRASTLPGTDNWTMAYDTRSQRLLMFDGEAVYYWTGRDWNQTSREPGLPELNDIAAAPDPVAYEPHLGVVLTIDRNCNRPAPTVVGSWDGVTWQRQATGPASDYGDIVFDAARDQMLMVGASCDGRPITTWVFDGKAWKQLHPATEPIIDTNGDRWDYGRNLMTYDPDTQQVLMIGRSSLWAWDGSNWSAVPNSGLPSGVSRAVTNYFHDNTTQVAYDEAEHLLVAVSTAITCDPCPFNPVT